MALGELGKCRVFFEIIVDENSWTFIELNFPMFLGTVYENPVTVLENAKWLIQYGDTNIEDFIICYWKKYFRILCKIFQIVRTFIFPITLLLWNSSVGECVINDNLEKSRYFPSSPSAILNPPLIESLHILEEVCT